MSTIARGLLQTAVLLALVLGSGCSKTDTPVATEPRDSQNRVSRELAGQLAALEARERLVSETAWAKEMLAQECGRTFDSLWDSLNAATNKLGLLAAFPVGEIVLGNWRPGRSLPHGIRHYEPAGPALALAAEAWRDRLESFTREGWQLTRAEFRHTRFDTDDAGEPRRSRFWFSAHAIHPARSERATVEGDLDVDWAPRIPGEESVPVKRVDASRLEILTRTGAPPFRLLLEAPITPAVNVETIGPLLLGDLDGDGLSEVVLGAKNAVYRRRGADRYEPEPLCRVPPGVIYAALIADFDGDGRADYLCQKFEGLFLYTGSPQGTFDEPSRKVWRAPSDVRSPFAIACGDMDRDGDLDVFLGQYKVPYENGSMPTPYYDANDGDPAYLLRNDGPAGFTEVTESSGLGQYRRRRTYAASFADLDRDGDQDLVTVSDFSGIALYRNDGRGSFGDVTDSWVAEPHAFGMAHALADFNADGRLDLLMIGMPSPTADRLEHLGLWRTEGAGERTMRARMTYGCRLILAREGGGFEQTAMSDTIARAGWAWGCSAFDFDNDGFPDVYIANGMDSRSTVQDYEGEFWLHDLYVGSSEENSAAHLYFQSKFNRTLGRGQSYGGYEKNRFYLNQQGSAFVEVGHLFGVALEEDSRNVVSDDLDGDGRVDLLVTSYEPWPSTQQILRVYRNELGQPGHWIGFRLRESAGGTPIGAEVAIRFGAHRSVRQIVTGDSHRAQHAFTLHFGLGEADRVDEVQVRWPDGEVRAELEPAIDRYHELASPKAKPHRP